MPKPRFRITYQLTCRPGEEAADKARQIAYEQTVELPGACVSDELRERIVGSVEAVEPLDEDRWRAVISYSRETVGNEIPQLLNLLFGNISLQRGIRVTHVDWPIAWLENFAGPRFGTGGLRRLCGAEEGRALLCAALKPMGLSARELAGISAEFASGGVDLVKDDHGLADQPSAPFLDRLLRCQDAVERANRKSGGSTLYVPNLTCRANELDERIERIRKAGCQAALISPLIVGPDTVRRISEEAGLALIAHPSLSGSYFHDDHGIAPAILLGQLFRIIGSDAVIYPNVGGRFPFTQATCSKINAGLRQPLGRLRPAFPVPGGGLDVRRVPHWIDQYGTDIIFLIGGGLYARTDLARASRELMEAIRLAAQ